MKHLNLHDGTPMPALGLGTWLSEPDAVYHAVRAALEVGYRHIDCAFIYQNEDEVGKALKEALAAGDIKREDLWITTKLWNDAHEPKAVRPALERSLTSLGLDYVDLYLIHWPVAHRPGVMRPERGDDYVALSDLPLASTWQAMAELPGTKLTKQVGVSNFSARQIEDISGKVGVVPAVNQVEMHPYLQQPELLAYLRSKGIVATAYCPLGSGGRPDAMKRPDEVRLLDDPRVASVAAAVGATPAQTLIAWALQRDTIVIPKSTNPRRIAQNWEAGSVKLTEEQMAELATLDAADRYVTGDFWCGPGSPYTLEELWG